MHALCEGILARIADSPHLPTPPAVALRFLERAREPDCSLRELAALISQDPSICAKLLRTVNSAVFGFARPVSSVGQALSLLGTASVRSLIIGLSLAELYQQTPLSAGLERFWSTSLSGAVLARELAGRLRRRNPEEDLVAALLRDLGVLVLTQVCPTDYEGILAESSRQSATALCDLETATLGANHAEVGSLLLSRWRLPADITEPIRFHHHPDEAAGKSVRERAHLLHFASQVAQLQVTPHQLGLRRDLLALARARFGLDGGQLRALLAQVNERTREFASILEVDVGAYPNLADLLLGATSALSRLTLEINASHLRTAQDKAGAERETRRWRRVAQRLRRETMRDALTKAYNRLYLEQALATELKRARRRGAAVGLLFIDLDDFKAFNDRFGHTFGDQVLVEVAQALLQEVRGGDVVARYAGDEFCVLIADATDTGLQTLANRLLARLNSLTIADNGHTSKVRASIGAVSFRPDLSARHERHLLVAADEAMYLAKLRGKNQVSLASFIAYEDKSIDREVQKRLFSRFLLVREAVTRPQIQKIEVASKGPRVFIGQLARRLRWLTSHQLTGILDEQRQTKRMFGDIAVRRGYLTQRQLCALLAIQREPPEDWANALVDSGLLTPAQARREVRAYLRAIRQREGPAKNTSPRH